MSNLVVAEGITKSFVSRRNKLGMVAERFDAVHQVNLEIAQGETLALVGESGSGKSTVGRLILHLTNLDTGTVKYQGEDLAKKSSQELRRLRAKMRIVFQDPYSSLDPTIEVGQAVAEPLLLHSSMTRAERKVAVAELFDRVGLGEHHLDRYPYEFSGGQLQRIAIARAIAPGPDFVVCDEPVAALDMSIRAQVVNLLRDLQEERGIAYLFITHDLSLVQLIADRTAVMFKGEIVELSPTPSLFENPRHPYTQALLDAVPVVDPAQRRERAAPRKPARSGVDSTTGCAYVARCPYAIDTCEHVAPQLGGDQQGHVVACHVANAKTNVQLESRSGQAAPSGENVP